MPEWAKEVAADLDKVLAKLEAAPTSREKAVAVTYLQTSLLWLKTVKQ